ncbi:hypothetical protein C8Q74DRAFT_1370231 [Fomes fomentarius]|nr:hypothetical protein C8Q74DRAFT_1370231 [Fomes fomentarius]
MLASVFNPKGTKRSKATKSRKFSTIGLRRAQSPPSPASFVSPEIVEINEKGPFGATCPEDLDRRDPSTSIDRTIPLTSPQIQLEFSGDSEPLTEWLPPSILSPPENRTPPKRNVSLPNGGRDLPPVASSSAARPREDTIKEEVEQREPAQPNRLYVDSSGFAYHARSSSEELRDNSVYPSTRKPTPSPIKIPNNVTKAKVRVQRSSPEDVTDSSIPPPLPTKGSRPPSPSSALTDDMSSAISGLHMNSFILNDSRGSKYKSGGMTRQDSATLPRGEHPLHNSTYLRERRASVGSPGSTRSSSVPPVPRVPSPSKRNSVTLVLESGDSIQLEAAPQLRRPKSTGRLRREQTMSMPPISPISEASSPAPSLPNTPVIIGQGQSNVSNASSRSLANSIAPPRSHLEGNASSSSLGTGEGSTGHVRAATEPPTRPSTAGSTTRPSTGGSSKQKQDMPRKTSLAPPNGAMPGTMRSSGAFAISNGRLAVTRTISESGVPRGGISQSSRPAALLPIGERPASVLVPPSPQPSVSSNGFNPIPTPTSGRFGNVQSSDSPVDSPDLLDNFPVQIAARERPVGPPPPLPLGRRSEDSGTVATSMHSSSGESLMSTALTDRQTFPETPNAFSPLWSASFTSPPGSGSGVSMDRNSTRSGPTRAPGVLDVLRMAQRAPASRMSGSQLDREPADIRNGATAVPPPVAMKRLTAIEEQVASRAVSAYSTLPEPPTSGALFGTFEPQQTQAVQSQAQFQDQNSHQTQSRGQTQNQNSNSSNTVSPAAQAKAAEASSQRHLRSVTNPDEPLGSPPPSYVPTYPNDPPPPPPLPHARSGTGDSSASRRSSFQSSSHLQASSSSMQSSVPQKRSLSPFPSPPNSSAPSSPGRSRLDAHASSISVDQPPPPYMDEVRSATPPVPQVPIAAPPPPPMLAPAPPARISTPELQPAPPPNTPLGVSHTPSDTTPNKRFTRSRPPLPHGPRKPSYSAAAARMRAESVSSLNSSGPSTSNPRVMSIMSHAAPRFQPSRVQFRGLTMEAAQWTLTSQQLQHVVSTAIRQSADASAIRILPCETLDHGLPDEIERLEDHVAELKTKYKLGVRKRNTLLAQVTRIAESGELSEGSAAVRMLEELNDVTDTLDLTAEELYVTTDQLDQLNHLRDVHQRSALAMALRKLNSSFLKQVGEVQRLREQVAMLEAERDEAWREAQEVAQEFDDFTDRIMTDASPLPSGSRSGKNADKDKDKDSITPSRRSSRVVLARKSSQRASKAGLRSMYRRSNRSSMSSNHRYSGAASPGVWTGQSANEDIPPVPPIPLRRDIFFPSGDLPTRSSMDSPSSDLRAMVQAQKELCEMLGISLDELKSQHHGPSRRQSMSAIPGLKSPASAAPTRRNSDIITPNHQRSFKV